MSDYSIELFELFSKEWELLDFTAVADSGMNIQLRGNFQSFEGEAYHASEWANKHSMHLVQTTVSYTRLKQFLNSNK